MVVVTAEAVRCPLCGAENESVGTCRICAYVFDHPLVLPIVPIVSAPAPAPVEPEVEPKTKTEAPVASETIEVAVDDKAVPEPKPKRRRALRRLVTGTAAVALVGAVVVGAVFAVPSLIEQADNAPQGQPEETARGDTDLWVAFEDPEGTFAVRLPRTPDRAETSDSSATGRVTTISYVARNGVSAVGVSKVVVAADALFDPATAAAATAQSIGATLTVTASGTDSSGRGYVEGRIENDTVHLVGRWIANGQTGYVLQVVTPFEAPDAATFTRLVASFQITG